MASPGGSCTFYVDLWPYSSPNDPNINTNTKTQVQEGHFTTEM
jgi:hypothetical protein